MESSNSNAFCKITVSRMYAGVSKNACKDVQYLVKLYTTPPQKWTSLRACSGNLALIINPFFPNSPFLYPLKTSENLPVFRCFQGAEKGCIGNEWVNPFLANAAIGNHRPGMGLNVFESNPPVIKFDSLNYYYADHNQPFTSVLRKRKKKKKQSSKIS